MTQLRKLLNLFENSCEPRSIPELAADLGVTPERAEGLIEFWIRKGELKVFDCSSACTTCGSSKECSLLVDLPPMYGLVDPTRDDKACNST